MRRGRGSGAKLLRQLRKVKKQAGPEYERFYPSELLYSHAPRELRKLLEENSSSATLLKNYINASSSFDPIDNPKMLATWRFLIKLTGF
jgi:hypothetical protein